MKYFEVTMDSPCYCGFKSTWYIEAEDEDAVYKTTKFDSALWEMRDYLAGWAEEDDDDECSEPSVDIEEINKEMYEERKDWGGCG